MIKLSEELLAKLASPEAFIRLNQGKVTFHSGATVTPVSKKAFLEARDLRKIYIVKEGGSYLEYKLYPNPVVVQ